MGVGKSALVIRLCSDFFAEEYDPTIEDCYRKTTEIDGMTFMLEILDTAGQEEFTSLRSSWVQKAHGAVVVYSITSKASFDETPRFFEEVMRVQDSDKVPVVLVGNKSDLESSREVSTKKGQEMAEKYGAGFYETSAKTNINVESVFNEGVMRVWKQQQGQAY
uniref:Small monomeric GTPase n=1 Tax=Paramoeba aestuarina TaxID=180227 RepID=A0A7S4JWX5_9EUKA|mmetsp:Transcript_13673/g.21197  ORF Transcript_13673/g.21197 Transcript_13673/m.21197 type:complete len:163 (+) Transcript_13673:281-769(+)|eukprot:CAMPEP_0201526504 /NCGR_PEP_ID=MMETSP0161_2-20130828/31995_1 /ASSEMBLY_ACC=CAM_ASM_000251 /TAXON_ID=180227 /ORGANISM="Neoparamoeba aestuarina, Strain SoJaBio B1-5/56/2" /LENGTH=162 /DNA_ID=CAMNT_0047926923 /DNA_START=245 /DNA_END=733 /DNA_ORIENTATION=+